MIPGVDKAASEDGEELALRHRFVGDTAALGAFAGNRQVQHLFLKPERQFISVCGDDLLADVGESAVPLQGTIGHGHHQEESGIVVEEPTIFLRRRSEAVNDVKRQRSMESEMESDRSLNLRHVLRVTVVFDETLV